MLRSKILIYFALISSLFGAKYLAVLDLEPAGLSNTEAKILTQRLTSKMIELSDYTVVERANIDKILKEQKFQHSGCTDSECAVEIGQLLNADVSVIGTASKFGKTYTLDCRIINVESGEAIESASYTHTGEIDELVKDGIESIAHKLLGIPYKKKISSGTTSKASSGYGATLDISSDPPGAEIYIGGNFFDTTPLILEDFPSGDYEVSIKLINFNDYTEFVKLQPRGKNIINADLLCLRSKLDGCGICDNDPSNDCVQDCAGDWGGTRVDADSDGICDEFWGTITDIDGNTYKTIKIGEQWWMAENLKVTHYNNGDEIPTGYSHSDWLNLSTGAYAVYPADDDFHSQKTYQGDNVGDVYGNLYNWYTVDDSRGVCPEGYHEPSDDEYKQLEMYLGMSESDANDDGWYRGTNEGSKLAGNADLWDYPHRLKENSEFGTSGFSALPAGDRGDNGYYGNLGYYGYFWSSSEINSIDAYYRELNYQFSTVDRNRDLTSLRKEHPEYPYYTKREGYSIRCVGD